MKIIEAIKQRNEDLRAKPVTIAFLGDSVTQGCFECYKTEQGLDTIFDYKSAYSTRVKEMLNFFLSFISKYQKCHFPVTVFPEDFFLQVLHFSNH